MAKTYYTDEAVKVIRRFYFWIPKRIILKILYANDLYMESKGLISKEVIKYWWKTEP